MMTPMHADLIKYSTAAAPTSHMHQVLHTRRKARRAAFFVFITEVFSHAHRSPMKATRPRTSTLF